MKIGDREVVPTKLGWADAETGEILVSIRGLSIPKEQPKNVEVVETTAEVEVFEAHEEVEVVGTPVDGGINSADVVQEPATEQKIEAPKKSKKTKKAAE